MKTKLLLLIIYCLLAFYSCQQKKEDQAHDLLINCLTDEFTNKNSSSCGNVIIFCKIKSDNKVVGYINADRLQAQFNHDNLNEKMTYHEFITNIMHGKIILDDKDVEGSFILSDRILLEYKKCSFTDFLNIYTDSVNKNKYSIKTGLSSEEKMTIVYCLFQSHYYTVFDDFSGLYFSKNIDVILQLPVEEIEIELQ